MLQRQEALAPYTPRIEQQQTFPPGTPLAVGQESAFVSVPTRRCDETALFRGFGIYDHWPASMRPGRVVRESKTSAKKP